MSFQALTDAIGFVGQRQKRDFLCDTDFRQEGERDIIEYPERSEGLSWILTFTIEDAKEVRE